MVLENIKFGRRYGLSIDAVDGSIVTVEMPITIDFSIVRNTFGSANKADIKIYNLAERTRNLLYKDRFSMIDKRLIVLRAGYSNSNPIIFKGELRSVESYREKTEFITSINALDAGNAIYNSVSNFTVSKGSSKKGALERLVSSLDNVDGLVIGEYNGTYKRGRSFSGNSWENVLSETNGKAFIDKQTVNVLNDNEAKSPRLLINSESGLLSSPRRSGNLLVFKMIFEPNLEVGQFIELESITNRIFNGVYKCVGISHSGTISAAVAGRLETEVSLYMGPQAIKVVN